MLRKLPTQAPITKPRIQLQLGNTRGVLHLRTHHTGNCSSRRPPRESGPSTGEVDGPRVIAPSLYSSPPPEDSFEITSTSGKKHATTMKPTTKPRLTIMIGSMAAVS